jgi:hypothetical protein
LQKVPLKFPLGKFFFWIPPLGALFKSVILFNRFKKCTQGGKQIFFLQGGNLKGIFFAGSKAKLVYFAGGKYLFTQKNITRG